MKRRGTRKGTGRGKAGEPLVRLVCIDAAIAAVGLAGPAALAAPGDLDPSFGEVGRSNLGFGGELWSVDVQDDGGVVFAGDDTYYGYYTAYEWFDFTGRLLPNGQPDADFVAAALEQTAVYDAAVQSDGKVVGVGTVRRPDGALKVQVFRLLPTGALDPAFGLGGLVVVADATTNEEYGRSVVIEPDGRIVVAGTRGAQLLVFRLTADGVLDPTFGSGGIHAWSTPASADSISSPVQLARTAAGGYRVLAHQYHVNGNTSQFGCSVHGLSPSGAADAGFGNGGVLGPDYDLYCNSMALDAGGRVLLGGSRSSSGITVERRQADGAVDPSFLPTAVADQFESVSALAAGETGSVFVAGRDSSGLLAARVARLRGDGSLDTQYGDAGAAHIVPRMSRATWATVSDMQALAGDALVIGGDAWRQPFVARLLGDAAGGGPGVLTADQPHVLATEEAGQAVVVVRRLGGSTGAVAVTYTAAAVDDGILQATPGEDYTAVTGNLSWADGDATEREIVVPLSTDTLAEAPEFLDVALSAPSGGAGLGATSTQVEIAGDGYPHGLLTLGADNTSVAEGGTVTLTVTRAPYAEGDVAVSLRLVEGSATAGADYIWSDVTVTLPAGQTGASLPVRIPTDKKNEPAENFTLELASPTGGAELGASTQARITILDTNRDSGGGGRFGWAGALLLGLAGWLRRRSMPHR